MSSLEGLDVREVIFVNERCRVDYMSMPDEVRESADQAIDALQNSLPLPIKWCQPLRSSLTGIDELRLPHSGNTYRVYLTLKCLWAVMVLDAGVKKSTKGVSIPKWQKERLETRFKKALEYCAEHEAELRSDYGKRKARRERFAGRIVHG